MKSAQLQNFQGALAAKSQLIRLPLAASEQKGIKAQNIEEQKQKEGERG